VGITPERMKTNINLFLRCIGKNLTREGRESLRDLSLETGYDEKWKLSIPESSPVAFNSGQPNVANNLHPEFFGSVVGPGERWTFSEYSLCFRVWSSNINHNYWKKTDSDLAKKTFKEKGERRLLLRLRFDLHEKQDGKLNSHHPWFHMQIGGKSRIDHLNPREEVPEGHYRYPPSIGAPRFPSFPMSFILLGRFILANYHPTDYESLCDNDYEWKSLIAREEKLIWEKFFNDIVQFFSSTLVQESCFDRIGMNSKLGWL